MTSTTLLGGVRQSVLLAVLVGLATASPAVAQGAAPNAAKECALLPAVNQGVPSAHAAVLEQGLLAAIANAEPALQSTDKTIAIIEGARASGVECDATVSSCAAELGALANVPIVYVARFLEHEDRGYWVELQRIDVVTGAELHVRRAALTIDEPAFGKAMKAIVDATISGDDVKTDLRSPPAGIALDTMLYAGGGAAFIVTVIAAAASAGFAVMTYATSNEKITSIEESLNAVATVRLLSTAAIGAGAVAAVAVVTGIGLTAAGGAVTVGNLEVE